MKRKIYDKLLEWKNNEIDIKPLMILGARQVGKTYIINEFCENEYKNFIKINLFNDKNIVNLYNDESLNSNQKYNHLKALLDFDLEKENTIFFIDEIQESEALISELKYFCEYHNNVRIICAGSLLGVKLKRSKFSFPVGKVKMLNMHPMDFEEFLNAAGKQMLVSEIKKHYDNNMEMPIALHNVALEYYRYYLICGGMPASIKNFIYNKCDVMKYDKTIIDDIIVAYFKDMKKYVLNDSESLKIEKTYQSVPNQISNESKKFMYSKIDKKSRSRDYELPLDWLLASNLILQSFKVSVPNIPLEGFVQNDIFKLFINDVGILNRMLKVRYSDILNDNLSLFKGAIAENYVASQFVSSEVDLYYWLSSGIAEIDFLIYNNDGIIPVEVKAGDNNQSKSLKFYMNKFKPKYAIRISTKNFGYNEETKIKSIPLYSVFLVK